MTTIGHVFIPLNPEHDGTVPTDLAAFARRAADRHVGIVFVIS
jgi:hypothetical protein